LNDWIIWLEIFAIALLILTALAVVQEIIETRKATKK
jgi:hypothetical protein